MRSSSEVEGCAQAYGGSIPSLPGGWFHLEDASHDGTASVATTPQVRFPIMRTILTSLLAGGTLLLAAGSAQASTNVCADVHGGFETDITAVGVSCPAARTIVRKWHRKAVNQGEGPGGTKYVGSYTCLSFAGDPEHVHVRCADGKKKIRFYAGP
jgi:hypothetical protein